MNILFVLCNIGIREILLIVVIILILFGARKIPQLMKGFGEGINEFKKATKGDNKDKDSDLKEIDK